MRVERRHLIVVIALTLAGAGCGQSEPATPPPPETPPADTSPGAAAPPTETGAPETPATPIAGNVTLSGKITAPVPADRPDPLRMSADTYCRAAHDGPVYPQGYAIAQDGAVQWAFVYVTAGLEGRTFATPDSPVVLDQVGCMYKPHVFGVQAGQPIEIHNSDKTLHNVHAMPKGPNKAFNIAHPPVPGMVHRKTFPKPEVMVRIKCDVHPWMNAYAGVLAHPFFAVTDAQGRYEISGLSPGTYTIAVWHERLGTIERNITIADDGPATLDAAFGTP